MAKKKSVKPIAAPTCIGDIIYHSVTERQLIEDIVSGAREFPACGKNGILLYGDYGTGKTTLARLLPDAIERNSGGSIPVVDFIACGQGITGPELMNKIENRSMLISGNYCGHHIFLLDEIDNLTQRAQASLKGAMGIPNTMFIMTTNFVSKVDAGVQNRCVRVNCNAAPAHDYLPFARRVLSDCGANPVSDDKLLPIIQQCKGSVRDLAEALQRIAAIHKLRAKMAAVA